MCRETALLVHKLVWYSAGIYRCKHLHNNYWNAGQIILFHQLSPSNLCDVNSPWSHTHTHTQCFLPHWYWWFNEAWKFGQFDWLSNGLAVCVCVCVRTNGSWYCQSFSKVLSLFEYCMHAHTRNAVIAPKICTFLLYV